ncbi:MAG: SDR family oxidoreductase, partial [Acidobacteriota bacterium]
MERADVAKREALNGDRPSRPGPTFSATDEEPQGTAYDGSEIAIIGMACRFPGADTPDAFWCNLQQGVESLTALSDEELRAAGVLESQIADPTYVRRASVIDHIEDFDARFFGYTPLEATIMDPQHRQFLECAWEVFERAGYNPSACSQPVGVFTGAKTNTYLFNVVAQRAKFPALDNFQIALGNDLAAMATRVSFKLDLRGPSYALHTACSTSLVAVHLACQSLLLDECSMAVAGGASINVPQRKGYPYAKGGILSSDGSCRTFDAQATGSNFGNGAGAVLLKPLANAIADGDHIHAVIRGSATNNDGAQKASFTAPGVEGQTEVLLEAMAAAGVTADDISYIEAHGTATDLGDSIEILALTEAFRASTQKVGSCAIGSAKTNLGHLEAAAGIAGLIKTALALEHRELPASLHFEQPNPCIDFASSPFVVNSQRRAWKLRRSSDRRIAGVSSFGIGSTNAHVILEQAPAPVPTSPDLPWQLLQLSARSSDALDAMTRNLGSHLQSGSREPALADVAYTLAVGRKSFEHRRAIVCRDLAEAKVALEQVSTDGESSAGSTGVVEATNRPVAFLMTGLGEHHVDMGLGLYRREPAFRDVVDRSAEILEPLLGMDLRQVLYPRGTDASEQAKADRATDGKLDFRSMLGRGSISTSSDAASARLDRTLYAQPALFIVEVALAELLRTHGITPAGMIGYSLGEYVCAHLAGVMSLQDALRLVARRAQLIDELPAGAMLAVSLAEDQMQPWLDAHDCSLAAVNGVTGCVAAGTLEAVSALELALGQAEVTHRRLVTTHAFHSHLMRPIASAWASVVEQTQLAAPTLPYVSNVTGTWIRDEEATDPAYWVRHLCQPVRFVEGLGTLLATAGEPALLEVGPGQSLCSFARLHPDGSQRQPIFATLRSRHGGGADAATFLNAVGNLWTRGVEIDSGARFAGQRRQRAPLPTYPFERQRHWLDPAPDTLARTSGLEVESTPADGPIKLADLERWLHRVVWKQSPLESSEDFRAASEVLHRNLEISGLWLLVADPSGVAKDLGNRLSKAGAQVVMASAGDVFDRSPDGSFQLRLDQSTDFEQLFEALGRRPDRIVHLCNLAPAAETVASPETHFAQVQKGGFYSLIAMAQALGGRQALSNGLEIDVITSGVEDVTGQEALAPERATVLGATLVLSQEHPLVGYRVVDFDLSSDPGTGETLSESESLVETLLAELTTDAAEGLVAYRNGQRFVRDFEPMTMPATEATTFRARGVYLITGGLGGIGLHLAEHLSRSYQARLILTRRTPLPPRETWDAWLADNAQRPADERDEATLQAITQVLNFEAMGSEVLVEAADVSDEKAMRHVIDNALKQFGALHGVVHAAGVLAEDTFKTAQLIDRDACERQFQPKAYGLYVLERVLEGIDLDFCTLYSSLSAILGGFGYIGYATANLFMDYFVARHNRTRDVPWQSVDWDSWHYQEDEAARSGLGTTLSELAMTPAEGVEALSRILTIDRPRRLVVSTGELRPRLDQWVELSQLRSASPASPTTEARPEVADPAELPQRIADVWCRILGNADFGHEDSFFDLGGNSLLAMQMIAELNRELQVEIAPMVLFDAPTVGALARHLQEASADVRSADGGAPKADARAQRTPVESTAGRPSGSDSTEIAVIGMSGRFPGAGSVDAFWENLCAGRESISFFTDEQLLASGVDPETLCDPQYVKARPILADVEHFDAALFGYSPREAEVMDPQHRLFLECAWEAFEDAGYDTRRTDQRVGVYAGASISSYMQGLVSNPDLEGSVDTFQVLLGNEKDSLTTRVSYKFDLRGPSMAIQTFCSTSLVAVHMACQGLNTGEADMALAGGISIIVPQVSGYRCQDGGINSHDGHVRAFDAKATGMVFGNGAGLVVLKRLDDALRDGDQIHAVIKGTAINNDGALKAGYSAASIDGQEAVVADALAASGIDPQTIGYVETHGSGTRLGDPVELTALTRAFRAHTDRRQFCAVGSVKTNVGHLDRAAGVTGLIKTVLALRHKTIPASLHFEQPNPEIDFAASPFYVNAELSDWPSEGPRRAGVTSLGIGGTNAHAVLEEAPVRAHLEESEGPQLLVLSAHTENALDNVTARLADALEQPDAPPLADVAFTLQVGRRELAHRRTLVCRNAE